jgi:ankyrin repeat protein
MTILIEEQLLTACEDGDCMTLFALVRNDAIDFSMHNGAPLRIAVKNGHWKVVKILLTLPKNRPDPTMHENLLFRQACELGHTEIVRYLLSLPSSRGVDPSARNSEALVLATKNNHAEIVKMLLQSKRTSATLFGYTEIATMFQSNPAPSAPPSDDPVNC